MKRLSTKWPDIFKGTSGIFYYRGTPPGQMKSIEVSLKTKDESEVEHLKFNLFKGIEESGADALRIKAGPLMVKFLLARRAELKRGKIRKRYFEQIEGAINNYLYPKFEDFLLVDVRPKAFLAMCKANLHKKRDWGNERKHLTGFLAWCVFEDYLRAAPQEFKIPDHEVRTRIVLTEAEIIRLFAAWQDRALLLYVAMYLFMGMRSSEIVLMEWSRVDLESAALQLKKKDVKTKKPRDLPINAFVLALLEERKARSKGPWVFPGGRNEKSPSAPRGRSSFCKPWASLLTRAGLNKELQPHDLRATFETYAAKHIGFTDIQREQMAGADIKVQKNRYIKLTANDLRGLENSVQVDGLALILEGKVGSGNLGSGD